MHSTQSEHAGGPQRRIDVITGARRSRPEDSWIEISSQASPSDIITTGLQIPRQPPTSVAGSSQDEYEESESESDRVMSSSNEDIEEDDTATALGAPVFTPQPNAFTRSSESYFPSVTHSDRLPTNRMPRPVTRPDHDAALRASLTTLLSCAAAVRPKERERHLATRNSQPTALRLVPESALMKPIKRRSRDTSRERHAKKIRAKEPVIEEPSALTTWMISAGVVLVFSAISFSAGYAWGREMGRPEEVNCGNCGREAIRSGGLRKLRWSSAQSVSV